MFKKLELLLRKYDFLTEKLNNYKQSNKELSITLKEISKISPIIKIYKLIKSLKKELTNNEVLLNDDDFSMRELAKEENFFLNKKINSLELKIKYLFLPKNSNDSKNVILEIRAGAGGDEASLFAGKLFSMYAKFAEKKNWKFEILTFSHGTKGGFKDISINIKGKNVYQWLKYESGVHRVQRIPVTESQGRIHTSACSIAVLPEAKEIDVKIDNKDIRIDVFRSSGPGGQSVNTTDSAIRITHIETGITVQCQDEKSQFKNKNKALKSLRAKLYHLKETKLNEQMAAKRKDMIKCGDRSDKIRTYNFPKDRCVDHRAGIESYNLMKLFSGNIDNLIFKIRKFFQKKEYK